MSCRLLDKAVCCLRLLDLNPLQTVRNQRSIKEQPTNLYVHTLLLVRQKQCWQLSRSTVSVYCQNWFFFIVGLFQCLCLKWEVHQESPEITHTQLFSCTYIITCFSVRKASCEFQPERHKAAKEKRRKQKERAASLPPTSHTFVCPKCGNRCASRIRLYRHQRACKNWPSTFATILVCEEWALSSWHACPVTCQSGCRMPCSGLFFLIPIYLGIQT